MLFWKCQISKNINTENWFVEQALVACKCYYPFKLKASEAAVSLCICRGQREWLKMNVCLWVAIWCALQCFCEENESPRIAHVVSTHIHRHRIVHNSNVPCAQDDFHMSNWFFAYLVHHIYVISVYSTTNSTLKLMMDVDTDTVSHFSFTRINQFE